MIDILVSSKTRVKLLLKFFLNSGMNAHLRGLESEFGESSNAIRLELNKLEEAGFLKSETQGNRKVFGANKNHPLFPDIHSILLKYTGIDQIIERVIQRLGNVEEVYLVGELGRGNDSPIIDLIFVGDIDKITLTEYIDRAEAFIRRKIRYVQFNRMEFDSNRESVLNGAHILLWKS